MYVTLEYIYIYIYIYMYTHACIHPMQCTINISYYSNKKEKDSKQYTYFPVTIIFISVGCNDVGYAVYGT